MRIALMLVVAAACSAKPARTQAQSGVPNVVFILADNLGYGEVGAYGGGLTRGAPKPRIDSLAKDGTRLLNANMETTFDLPVKYPVPMVYNLFTDPREEKPTPDSWVVGPVLKIVGDFDKSAKENPLIPMGTPDPYRP